MGRSTLVELRCTSLFALMVVSRVRVRVRVSVRVQVRVQVRVSEISIWIIVFNHFVLCQVLLSCNADWSQKEDATESLSKQRLDLNLILTQIRTCIPSSSLS